MNKHTIKQSKKYDDLQYTLVYTVIIISVALFVLFLSVPSAPPLLENLQQEIQSKFTVVQTAPENPPVPVKVQFVDRTLESGLLAVHHQRSEHITALNEALGGGACAIDFDNDGWMDIFVVGGSGSTRFYGRHQWWQKKKGNQLYRNMGNGRFTEVTTSAGLSAVDWGMGCVAADLDNDGDTDLYLTNYGPNRLYENTGDGKFRELVDSDTVAGLEDAWSTTATVADVDGDGLLDIYITNYLHYKKGMFTLETGAGFDTGPPRDMQAGLFDSQSNVLLINQGDMVFKDLTEQAGVANTEGRSLSAYWLDLNGDRRPDLYVANDTGLPDKVYLNSGNKHFREAGDILNISDPVSTTSIAAGDLDNDGDDDILLGSRAARVTRLLWNTGKQSDTDKQTPPLFEESARLRFDDIEATNVTRNWGAGIVDFNLDGFLDIYLVNGLTTPDADARNAITTGQPDQLWLNHGDGRFKLATDVHVDSLQYAWPGRGSVFADFDNDGDSDIFINNNNESSRLLINSLPSSFWIGVQLRGHAVNRDGVGAKVQITANGYQQFRTAGMNAGLLSSSDPRMVFGFRNAPENLTLRVSWPDGSVDTVVNPPLNSYISILQGENTARKISTAVVESGNSHFLAAGQKIPEFRLRYLKTLSSEKSPLLYDEITHALHDPVDDVRSTAAELIDTLSLRERIPLLAGMLNDTSGKYRIQALKSLAETEHEAVFSTLIRYLYDSDSTLRLIATETFFGYFLKEEAMVIHKYQAIPHLIRRLADPSMPVKLAAIDALGASEHFRATGPLIELLSDQSEKLRRAAAITLGHVRERIVIDKLENALSTETSAGVMANIFISLKRLNAEGIEEKLTTLLFREEVSIDKAALVQSIFQGKIDSTVFDANKLALHTTNKINELRQQQSSHEEIATYLDMLVRLGNVESISTLEKFVADENVAVRRSACFGLAILALHTWNGRYSEHCKASLDNDPERFFLTAARRIAKGRNKLDYRVVRQVFVDIQVKKIASYFDLFSNDSIPDRLLMKIALLKSAAPSLRAHALSILSKRGQPPNEISNQLLLNEDTEIQIQAILYWKDHVIQNLPKSTIISTFNERFGSDNTDSVNKALVSVLLNMPEKTALYLLDNWLMNTRKPDNKRKYLLEAVSENHRFLKLVLILARMRHEQISLNAILALGRYKDERAIDYLKQVYHNKNETDLARIAAGLALYPINASTIIPFLTGVSR